MPTSWAISERRLSVELSGYLLLGQLLPRVLGLSLLGMHGLIL